MHLCGLAPWNTHTHSHMQVAVYHIQTIFTGEHIKKTGKEMKVKRIVDILTGYASRQEAQNL